MASDPRLHDSRLVDTRNSRKGQFSKPVAENDRVIGSNRTAYGRNPYPTGPMGTSLANAVVDDLFGAVPEDNILESEFEYGYVPESPILDAEMDYGFLGGIFSPKKKARKKAEVSQAKADLAAAKAKLKEVKKTPVRKFGFDPRQVDARHIDSRVIDTRTGGKMESDFEDEFIASPKYGALSEEDIIWLTSQFSTKHDVRKIHPRLISMPYADLMEKYDALKGRHPEAPDRKFGAIDDDELVWLLSDMDEDDDEDDEFGFWYGSDHDDDDEDDEDDEDLEYDEEDFDAYGAITKRGKRKRRKRLKAKYLKAKSKGNLGRAQRLRRRKKKVGYRLRKHGVHASLDKLNANLAAARASGDWDRASKLENRIAQVESASSGGSFRDMIAAGSSARY